MKDPYELLGVPVDADEAQVRQRYLELVRENPPDRAPEQFREIRAAYDAIRDPARRLEARIFEIRSRTDGLEVIADQLRGRLKAARFPVSLLVKWADAT
jgi:curved DNA-binding protein CbpA